MRFYFYGDEIKEDALAIWRKLKPKRYRLIGEAPQTVMYSFHWLWFALSFRRDIRKTRWKDLYKETKENGE